MQFAEYATRYNTIRFERNDGVLELTMHTRGGEARWGRSPSSPHAEFGNAFQCCWGQTAAATFYWTGQRLSAQQALKLGIVSEVTSR